MKNKLFIIFCAISLVFFAGCSVGNPFTSKTDVSGEKVSVPENSDSQTKPDEKPMPPPIPSWKIVEEKILFEVPQGQEVQKTGSNHYLTPDINFSKDNEHFNYGAFRKDAQFKLFTITDGKVGPYKRPSDEDLSRNIQDVGNVTRLTPVKEGDKYVLKIDGKKVAEAENSKQVLENASMSKDKKQFAYALTDGGGAWFAVANSVKGREYQIIGPQTCSKGSQSNPCGTFAFSFDGKQNAYIAKKGSMFAIVVNGKEREVYNHIYAPMFSFGSDHVAYMANDASKSFVSVDGKVQKKYGEVYNAHFDKDGRLIYNAYDNGKILKVVEVFSL